MNVCDNCGAQQKDGVNFCPGCGKPANKTNSSSTNQNSGNQNSGAGSPGGNQGFNFSSNDINQKLHDFNNTNDYTSEYDPSDIQNNKVMAVLAYIYLLFLVPLLGAPGSKFARFHANQGLVLFIVQLIFNVPLSIIIAIISAMPFIGWLAVILNVLRLIPVIFMVIGIYNAANGKAKELPLIGKFKFLN